ncbi:MAG: response regulator transcription factor [Tepidiformaceae bacterium]
MTSASDRRTIRILVVDDSPEILSIVQRGLQRRGYDVLTASDGESALKAFSREIPDLVILDLLLPDTDGIDLCYQLQEIAEIPVIMLTSRDGVSDRVEGLRAGADDYVVKPFAMEELAARIEAVLRRRPASPATIVYDDLVMDVEGHLVLRAGETIPLTPKEFLLLELMARKPNRVFTRETLMALLWPANESVDDNLLDAHATNLRQKLEANGGRRIIQTVRGIGFVLR